MADRLDEILVIDDDPSTRNALQTILRRSNYLIRLAICGEDGCRMAVEHPPDLVILDMLLPDTSGLEVCRELRTWYAGPILILSMRGIDTEKATVLDAGADDYLTKPYAVVELLARIRALLRRVNRPEERLPTLTAGKLTIDFSGHRITYDGIEIDVTPLEYQILLVLARQAGCVVPHRDILDAVWTSSYTDDVQILRVHISRLRKKLPADVIHTEPGVGFRLRME